MNRRSSKKLIVFILFLIIFVVILFGPDYQRDAKSSELGFHPDLIENISFNFNETGFPFNVVPNIVHYILFDVTNITFGHFISLLSVMKNHKPDLIYIHCTEKQLSGDNYERTLRVANKTNSQLIVRTIEKPTQIFGHNLSKKWGNWDLSDFLRMQVLMEFGGIYLDSDMYVVQALDEFRKYETTLEWNGETNVYTGILMANKNSRFLKLMLKSFQEYDSENIYGWSGVIVPSMLLKEQPYLVHRINGEFGQNSVDVCPKIYFSYYENWSKEYFTIHLSIRGNEISFKKYCFRKMKGQNNLRTFYNESIVRQLDVTFGEMCRNVYDFEKEMISN